VVKLCGSSTLEDTDGNGNGNGNDRGMRFVGMSCAFQYQQLFLLLLNMNYNAKDMISEFRLNGAISLQRHTWRTCPRPKAVTLMIGYQ